MIPRFQYDFITYFPLPVVYTPDLHLHGPSSLDTLQRYK
jgi:hypothetical protein